MILLSLFLSTLTTYAGVMYLFGFFPLKTNMAGFSNFSDVDYEPTVSNAEPLTRSEDPPKLVFIVVDALRADFVLPSMQQETPLDRMRFVSSLVRDNFTYSFTCIVDTPTVTMPRIKALMTGSIPAYIEALFNTVSQSLDEDNFIHQLVKERKKVIFYGDNTWMKLFPESFIRADGVTSFFVNDYTEVDNNVTRHLSSELANPSEWDVMVLHYLGLDHIGHLAGPRSPLVKPKLDEIDAIIKRIYDSLAEYGNDSLLVICGDHGMSDKGSHGGATVSETRVPFILIKPKDNGGITFDTQREVRQIDIPTTLSVLMGTPVPKNSLGTALVECLDHMTRRSKMAVYYRNAIRLCAIMKANFINYKQDATYLEVQRVISAHRAWLNSSQSYDSDIISRYRGSSVRMRDVIRESMTNYDLFCLWITMTIVISLTAYVALSLFEGRQSYISPHVRGVTLAVSLSLIFVYTMVGTSTFGDSICFRRGHLVVNSVLFIVNVGSLIFLWTSCYTFIVHLFTNLYKGYGSGSTTTLTYFLIGGCSLHSISLVSSSFIEEEHQTLYFLTVTACLFIVVHLVRQFCSGQHSAKFYRSLWPMLILLTTCRVSRSWNNTGDKWSHLADISDWLKTPLNKKYLSSLNVISSTALILLLRKLRGHRSHFDDFLMTLVMALVYCYRANEGDLYSLGLPSKYAPQMVYLIILIKFLRSLYKLLTSKDNKRIGIFYRDQFENCCLLSVLLLRPHNLSMLTIRVLQTAALVRITSTLSSSERLLLFIWFGQAGFFYQGNSNNVSTIDISSGFVGFSDNSEDPSTLKSLMMLVIVIFTTYNSQLASLFACLGHAASNLHERKHIIYKQILLERLLPLTVIFVQSYLQRYHLFVWSVFSPKLLYECMCTLVAVTFCNLFVLPMNFSTFSKLK